MKEMVHMRGPAAKIMKATAVTSVGLLASFVALSPAPATTVDPDPLAAVRAVTERATSPAEAVLHDVAHVPTLDSGPAAIDAVVQGVSVSVPTDPADPVVIEAHGGTATTVELPNQGERMRADAIDAGVVTNRHDDESSTTVVAKANGAVQVVITMSDRSAPEAISFHMKAGPGSVVKVLADGTASIVDRDGFEAATIAAPWARDAAGRRVGTHYVARGDELVQVIDHRVAGVTYPVVADPAITASAYQYVATNVTKKTNQPNRKKRVGSCTVGTSGASCTISGTYSVSSTINAALGLSKSGVAATLGISATASVSGSIACHSPVLVKGESWNAYIKGTYRYFTLKKYKLTKAGGITAKKLVSTAAGQIAFTPTKGIYCAK